MTPLKSEFHLTTLGISPGKVITVWKPAYPIMLVDGDGKSVVCDEVRFKMVDPKDSGLMVNIVFSDQGEGNWRLRFLVGADNSFKFASAYRRYRRIAKTRCGAPDDYVSVAIVGDQTLFFRDPKDGYVEKIPDLL